MSNKQNLIKALNNLNVAFKELDSVWNDLDSTKAIELYPFAISFDELALGVEEWVEETVCELEKGGIDMIKYYVDNTENSDTKDWVFIAESISEDSKVIEVCSEPTNESFTFNKDELTEITKEEYDRLLDILID